MSFGCAYPAPPRARSSSPQIHARLAALHALPEADAERVEEALWLIEFAADAFVIEAILEEAGTRRAALEAAMPHGSHLKHAAYLCCEAREAFEAGLARARHMRAVAHACRHDIFIVGRQRREEFLEIDWQTVLARVTQAVPHATGRLSVRGMPLAPLPPLADEAALLEVHIEMAGRLQPTFVKGSVRTRRRSSVVTCTAVFDATSGRLSIGSSSKSRRLRREIAKAIALQISGRTGAPVKIEPERPDLHRLLDPAPFATDPDDNVLRVALVSLAWSAANNPSNVTHDESPGKDPECLRPTLFAKGLRRHSLVALHEATLRIEYVGKTGRKRAARLRICQSGHISMYRLSPIAWKARFAYLNRWGVLKGRAVGVS